MQQQQKKLFFIFSSYLPPATLRVFKAPLVSLQEKEREL
jgi:hypothetical protein